MQTHARWLFGIAATFNFAVAAGLLLFRSRMAAALQLDPIAGTNIVLLYMTGAFIALFGGTYFLIARDPMRYRVFVPLGIVGKLMAVACAVLPWFAGQIPATVPALAGGDLLFVLLFWDFLRRYRPAT